MTVPKFILVILGSLGEIGGPVSHSGFALQVRVDWRDSNKAVRFPNLATENIGLVDVHPSMQAMDPIANLGTMRHVVAPVEENYQVYIALELNLSPYHEIGCITTACKHRQVVSCI